MKELISIREVRLGWSRRGSNEIGPRRIFERRVGGCRRIEGLIVRVMRDADPI